MGAHATLVNDTPDPWHCIISSAVPPQVHWLTVATPVLEAVSTTYKINPKLVSAATDTSIGIYNVPKLMMAGVEPLISSEIATANNGTLTTKIGGAVSNGVVKALHNKGYILIKPGERQQPETVTNSFKQGDVSVQQVDCKRVSTQDTHVTMLTVRLSDVKIEDKDTDYSMQTWLNQNTPTREIIRAYTKQMGVHNRELEEDDY